MFQISYVVSEKGKGNSRIKVINLCDFGLLNGVLDMTPKGQTTFCLSKKKDKLGSIRIKNFSIKYHYQESGNLQNGRKIFVNNMYDNA